MARNLSKILLLLTIITGLLGISNNALAKGNSLPPEKVRIKGPGLDNPLEITDPGSLEVFSFVGFDDLSRRIEEPDHPGVGYLVMRYLDNGTKFMPKDRVIYYPQTFGQRGYIVYDGLLGPESWTPLDGSWYLANEVEDSKLRTILENAVSAEVLNELLLRAFEPYIHEITLVTCGMTKCLILQP